MVSRMTKLFKDFRWIVWLRYFLAGVCVIIILSLVYWCAQNEREISALRIELKSISSEHKDNKQFIENLKRERESLMKLPLSEVPGI